jgi:4-hydroxythreonine-4-phosphate dehydrogenase
MVIVADDLSGAADCGMACVNCGLDVVAVLDQTCDAPAVDVLCLDADTRHLPAARAGAETARLLARHAGPGTLVYKKMDSTLRGHVGVEIAAALGVLRSFDPGAVGIVAPAYPGTGRTTRGGRQYVDGVPVEETEIWHGMTGRADLPALLTADGLSVALLSVQPEAQLALAMAEAAKTHDILVCDAESDDDLAAIARAGHSLGGPVLWAGSGGLARHLPAAYDLKPVAARSIEIPPVTGPLLFIVGSRSSISRMQAEQLVADVKVTPHLVPATALDGDPESAIWKEQQVRLRGVFEAGGDVLVRLGDEVTSLDGSQLSAALAKLLAPFVARCGGVFLTGGETAHALLKVIGAAGLRLIREIEPGITLSMVRGGIFDGRPVVIKAGAFGSSDTMRHCQAVLHADNAETTTSGT